MATTVDISKFLAGLKQEQARRHSVAIATVADFATLVLRESQALCPVAMVPQTDAPPPGTLLESAFQEPVTVEAGMIIAVIGYAAPYAALVHERLDVHHPHGQAKFLETPMTTHGPQFPAFVAARMETA